MNKYLETSFSQIKCDILTCACDSIPSVSRVTGAEEAPGSVGTLCIAVTVISTSSTFINIWGEKQSGMLRMFAFFNNKKISVSITANFIFNWEVHPRTMAWHIKEDANTTKQENIVPSHKCHATLKSFAQSFQDK